MLRLIQTGRALPISLPVDPTAEFQGGNIAQLKVLGNNIVCGVSDGTAPIGIIDDIKTNAFTSVSINESVIVGPITGVSNNGTLVSSEDYMVALENPHISPNSFTSNPIDVELNPKNGIITFLAGTPLNINLSGGSQFDGIKTTVSYTYQVPNVPGDDSTAGTGRVTLWIDRGIYETDIYETNQRYPINSVLFVSEEGKLTTRQPTTAHAAVAIVTATPTTVFGSLQFMWL